MRKAVIIVGGLLVLLAAAGGAFFGGMLYERSRRANTQARFFAERGEFPGAPDGFVFEGPSQGFGQPGGGMLPQGQAGFGRGAVGTVKSLEGDKLLLSTPEDVTAVVLNDLTVIRRLVVGERSDLQPGQRVVVAGERAEDGTLTATSIQILSEEP